MISCACMEIVSRNNINIETNRFLAACKISNPFYYL